MRMTDDEANYLYNELSQIVRQADMGWVLTGVSKELRLGKLEAKKVLTADAEGAEEGAPPSPLKRPPAMFTATTAYPPKDRLRILVGAIEQAWVATTQMDEHIAHVFANEFQRSGNQPVTSFAFRSEDDTHENVSDEAVRARRIEAAAKLKPLITELREAINAA